MGLSRMIMMSLTRNTMIEGMCRGLFRSRMDTCAIPRASQVKSGNRRRSVPVMLVQLLLTMAILQYAMTIFTLMSQRCCGVDDVLMTMFRPAMKMIIHDGDDGSSQRR